MDTTSVIGDSRAAVFRQLSGFVTGIIGSDAVEEIGISPESVFTRDLEMDSIEIVAFAEAVKRQYGAKVDFVAWLSGMELQAMYNLSLGQVVDYIVGGNDAHS
jgi:acyl carrier protein